MTSEIVPEDQTPANLAQVSPEDLLGLGSGRKYLPYFSLVAKTSKIVDKGAIPGHFVMVQGDTIEDFGTSVDCKIIDLRMKATHLNNSSMMATSYVKSSPLFQDILTKSKTAKYGDADGYLWGAEYLLWVPKARNGMGAFTLYFMSAESARSEAENINKYSGLISRTPDGGTVRTPVQATFTSKLIPGAKASFFVPVFHPCSAVFTTLPDPQELADTLKNFLNPPVEEKEPAPDAGRVR